MINLTVTLNDNASWFSMARDNHGAEREWNEWNN